MNEIHVTMRGNVVTDPRHVQLRDGTAVASFRLACTPRRWDREREEWVSRETVWVTVNCWRSLATNVTVAVRKGQPVLVTGRLSERTWSTDERSGRDLELEAETVGHDLVMGTAEFARTVRGERVAGDFRSYEPAGLVGDPGPAETEDEPVAAGSGSQERSGPGNGFPGLVVLDDEVVPAGRADGANPAARRRAKAAVS